MSNLDKIKEEGEDLALEESKRIHCPFCNDRTEKSMYITRKPAGVAYICYRASCNQYGYTNAPPPNPALRKAAREYGKKPFQPKVNTSQLVNVPPNVLTAMLSPYGLSLGDATRQHFKWDTAAQRLSMPVFDRSGYKIGTVDKAMDKNVVPKAILHRHEDVPMLHFPLYQKLDKKITLVEALISSVKVAKVTPCAALLGSSVSKAILDKLTKEGFSDIVLMLDEDAFAKAIKIQQRIGHLFKSFRIVKLDKGLKPKDLSLEQIKELVR